MIEPQFDTAYSFTEYGVATVMSGGKWGYADKTGKMITDFVFTDAGFFMEGFVIVIQDG